MYNYYAVIAMASTTTAWNRGSRYSCELLTV